MKKAIFAILATAGLALTAGPGAFGKGYVKSNYDSGRARGQNFSDLRADPSTNDDQVIQVDFKFPAANLPNTEGTHIGLIARNEANFPNSFSGGGNGNSLAGIPSSYKYVMCEVFPNTPSNFESAPLRIALVSSDGSAKLTFTQGLTVTANGSSSVVYDHNWHRLVFSVLGGGVFGNAANITVSVDGVTYLSYLGSTTLPMPFGGRFTLLTENASGSAPGANIVTNNVKYDNLRMAYTAATLATAPVINDNFDSYTFGSTDNGNNGSNYAPGGDDNATVQATTADDYAITGGFGAVQGTEESDYFNVSQTAPAPRRGCIYLNQTAAGQNYNIVALDDTAYNNDQTDVIADVKFPTALSAAQANALGVTGFVTHRLVGGRGAHNPANNNPGVEFSVSVTAGGFLQFDIVQRTGTNVSDSAGTSLGSFVSSIAYDHNWHRFETRIPTGDVPQILWDGISVLTGSSAGAGRAGTLATGFFTGGNNAGPVPIDTPTTLTALASPNTVTAAGAPDEFLAIGQYMTGATTAAQNIRWDNIRQGNPATPNSTVAIFDNISSYGANSQIGTVANNTALRSSASLADPWYTIAGAGGSNPAQWAIDTTDNSSIGVSGLNPVNDFFVY